MIHAKLILHRGDDHPTLIDLEQAPTQLHIATTATAAGLINGQPEDLTLEITAIYQLIHRTWPATTSTNDPEATYLFQGLA